MNRTLRSILAVLCIGIIAICTALLFNKISGRAGADLTDHKLYTLSEGTYNIIGKIAQPITLKLYYSRTAAMKGPEGIRHYNNYYLYVKDLLEEYSEIAGEKIKFEIIDPRPFSDEEEEAIRYGVKRFQITENESFFFGLVAETQLGKSKAIEFFAHDRQEFVEYDVSKLISGVTIRDKKKVGVLSSLDIISPEMSPYMMQMMQMQGKQMPKSWTVITHLKEKYDLQNIKMDDVNAIGDDIDYLLVVHPKKLSEKTLFAIDQFVMKGGRLIVFTDPHCISDQPKKDPRNPYAAMSYDTSSNLDALLAKWGLKMASKQIVVDPKLAIETPMQRNSNPEPFLPFIQLDPECFNSKEVITSTLQDVRVVFAGSLEKTSAEGVNISPLITASDDGGTWQISNKWELQRPDTSKILKDMIRSGKETMLAALITGKLQSNFPDGIEVEDEKADDVNKDKDKADKDVKKEEQKTKKRLSSVKETTKDAMVIVVSDVDLISDMIAYQSSFFGMAQSGDNVNLLFNALDFMSGSTDLISIRSRGNINREFTAVKEIERDADQATAAEAEVINNKIKGYRQKLNSIGGSATEKNQKLIESKAVSERRKIEEEIRKANKALRDLQAGKREKVEALENYYKFVNTVVTSAIVLLIAIILSIHRIFRARRYAARRAR